MDTLPFSETPASVQRKLAALQSKGRKKRILTEPKLKHDSLCYRFEDIDDFFEFAVPQYWANHPHSMNFSKLEDRILEFALSHEARWALPLRNHGCGYYDRLVLTDKGSDTVWFDGLCTDQGLTPQFQSPKTLKIHSYISWCRARDAESQR